MEKLCGSVALSLIFLWLAGWGIYVSGVDFRAVYAKVLDGWLGADSVPILGGDFRAQAPAII